jgi:hypothetical protein
VPLSRYFRALRFGTGIALFPVEDRAMKTTLCVLFLLFAAAAFGQQSASVLPSQPVVLEMPDHTQHATQHEMATVQNILHDSAYTYAKGERPLWEFGPVSQPTPPLGDVARSFRKEHESAKKASFVLEK